MTITDEMVEKVAKTFSNNEMPCDWLEMTDEGRRSFLEPARAALEAVAPMLIAQGMREAAEMLPGGVLAYFDGIEVKNRHCNPDAEAILARAQELDPK